MRKLVDAYQSYLNADISTRTLVCIFGLVKKKKTTYIAHMNYPSPFWLVKSQIFLQSAGNLSFGAHFGLGTPGQCRDMDVHLATKGGFHVKYQVRPGPHS